MSSFHTYRNRVKAAFLHFSKQLKLWKDIYSYCVLIKHADCTNFKLLTSALRPTEVQKPIYNTYFHDPKIGQNRVNTYCILKTNCFRVKQTSGNDSAALKTPISIPKIPKIDKI